MSSSFYAALLRRYVLLETYDFDRATEATARALLGHEAELASPREKFYCSLSHARLTDISLGCWIGQGRLDIRAGPSSSSYLVRLQFEGACEYGLARETVLLSRDWTVIQSPEDVAKIRTSEFSEILGFAIDEAAVAREMENRLGHPLGAMIKFAPGMNMKSAIGQSFRRDVIGLCLELDKNFTEHPDRSLGVRQMERSLVSLLIDGHLHNYTRLLHRETSTGPWQVRAVEEFIREHADQALSLGDLAVIGGVSARSLQHTFRRHRGCSPMEFLRQIRFERLRNELLHPIHGTTVTSAAVRWGFLHLGRFAAEYRARFNESPSETLRRSL